MPVWLSSLLSIAANALGWGREKDARKNTPAMQANKVAQDDAALMERIAALESRVAAGDVTAKAELENLLGEN